jgi:hypothetical protein
MEAFKRTLVNFIGISLPKIFKSAIFNQVTLKLSKLFSTISEKTHNTLNLIPQAKKLKLIFVAEHWVCIPGFLLMLMAGSMIIVPEALPFLIALFTFFFGMVMISVGIKYVAIRKKANQISRNFSGNLVLQAVALSDEQANTTINSEEKKFVVH